MTKEEAYKEMYREALQANEVTRCQITNMAVFENDDIEITLRVVIKEDDVHAVRQFIRPSLEDTFDREFTLSEALHTCLTYGIHQCYEEVTGKPFTLRMDRKPN